MNWFPYNSNLRQERVNLHSRTCYFSHATREKCPNTEFSLVRIFLNSVRIQENRDQKNFIFGPFSYSDELLCEGVHFCVLKAIICGAPHVFYKEISWKQTYKLYILSKRPSDIIQYTYLISTISWRAGFIFQNSRPVLFPMYFAKLSMSMHAYFETTLGDCIRYSIQQRSSWNNSKILAIPLFYYSNRYLSSKTFSLPMHSRTSSCLSQQ